MRPQMTPAVERALTLAQNWARREAASEIAPAHLLWALLEEEDGRAAVLLAEHGLPLEQIRPMQPEGEVPEDLKNELPLGALARESLAEARELAFHVSLEQAVSSECLLLGLLRSDESLRYQLMALELNHATLEEAIAGQVGEPVELDEPLLFEVTTEQFHLARILDACANRAREALRVVEDYCRFALDDALLTQELKTLRHRLTQALSAFSTSHLIQARDTQQDVGTTLTTASEQKRFSLREVAHVNWKRFQEALRSLEENGKIHSAEMGRELEQIRYQSYSLERAFFLGSNARERLQDCQIQVLVTGSACKVSLEWTITEALAGGADLIQLREKDLPDRELITRARKVRQWTRDADALFIVNDRPDLAALVEADGVHLGQDDLPVKEARKILGPDSIIGVSTHTHEELRQAILDGASYVGIGPTFPSGTKNFDRLAGLDYVREALQETSLPAFVIGGVNVKTLPAAVEAGATRIAVSQAVTWSEEPRAVVRELRRLLAGTAPVQ